MRKPIKGGVKITSYKEVADVEGARIFAVKTVGSKRTVSSRDFEGNIYNLKGENVGNINN